MSQLLSLLTTILLMASPWVPWPPKHRHPTTWDSNGLNAAKLNASSVFFGQKVVSTEQTTLANIIQPFIIRKFDLPWWLTRYHHNRYPPNCICTYNSGDIPLECVTFIFYKIVFLAVSRGYWIAFRELFTCKGVLICIFQSPVGLSSPAWLTKHRPELQVHSTTQVAG